MEKSNPPKTPTLLLLILFVLIVGILISTKISQSTNKGTLLKVQQKHSEEKEVYNNTPGL